MVLSSSDTRLSQSSPSWYCCSQRNAQVLAQLAPHAAAASASASPGDSQLGPRCAALLNDLSSKLEALPERWLQARALWLVAHALPLTPDASAAAAVTAAAAGFCSLAARCSEEATAQAAAGQQAARAGTLAAAASLSHGCNARLSALALEAETALRAAAVLLRRCTLAAGPAAAHRATVEAAAAELAGWFDPRLFAAESLAKAIAGAAQGRRVPFGCLSLHLALSPLAACGCLGSVAALQNPTARHLPFTRSLTTRPTTLLLRKPFSQLSPQIRRGGRARWRHVRGRPNCARTGVRG